MKTNDIGKILFYLRKKLNISQLELCKGLCSVSHISRVESGDRIPDMLLMEALFQRMGKSSDKIEIMLSERDYTLCVMRMEIERLLQEKNYPCAEIQIDKYSKAKEADLILHKQYIYKIKSIIELDARNDIQKSKEFLMQAIEITMPNFCYEKISGYLLSVKEIQLLLLQAQLYMLEREDEALVLLTLLEQYVEQHYSDEEEKVKIYPKIIYLLSKILLKLDMYNKAAGLCKKAIDLLVDNGVIVCLLELLEFYIKVLKRLNCKEEKVLIQKECIVLKELYREYNIKLFDNKINIWQENTQKDIYLVHELIKKNREDRKITQENLTEKIEREQETISRIETGKRAPSRKTFESIKEELNIDRNYYTVNISAKEFEVYEKKREISKLIFLEKYKDAQQYLEEIKRIISSSVEENKQYILYTETIINLKLKVLTPLEALDNYIKSLEYTRKNYFSNELLTGLLTRQEVIIINNISIVYQYLGYCNKSILLLEKVLDGFEQSSVDLYFHSVGCLLTIMNLSYYYKEKNDYSNALKLCKKGIALSLQCGRGNSISKFLATQAYVIEWINKDKMNKYNKRTCLYKYKQAILFSKLLKNSTVSTLLEQRVKANFQIEII